MAKYILLANWTDQGIRNIKDRRSALMPASHCEATGLRLREFLHDHGQLRHDFGD
jgi:uncharacterized protein with GYD domain